MTIARTVQSACEAQGCEFDLWTHDHTQHSLATAKRAHVSVDRLAKGVVMEDRDGPVLVVIPADRYVDTKRLNGLLNRNLHLMSESKLGARFPDCEMGAIPATGMAYSMLTITDAALLDEKDVWFEAGDHESLVHMTGESFRHLMENSGVASISQLA